MQILEINVGKNREVSLFVNKGGNIGENNETLLKFTVPEEFKNHYKYLDIIKNDTEKTQTVLDVGKNYEFTYTLPAFLTENRELYLQLVMKLKDEIFLSNIFVIKFDESICATQYIADNSCDTIQYLMENKADNENVNLISCELTGKLSSNVYYDELGRIYKSLDEKVDKIPGKDLSANDYTNEEKEKLSVTGRNLELHIENKNNPHNIEKEQIGLGNVDNTSDINKPISIKTQNALDEKVDKIPGKELSENDYTNEEKEKLSVTKRNLELHIENKNNPHNITKEQIGLGNVDNTRDLSKPVSIATQNALDLKADKDYALNLESRMDNHGSNNILHITNDERNSWNNKVDKEEGKKLSTEDFTSELKEKLIELPTNDVLEENFNEKADILKLTTDISKVHKITDSGEQKIVDIEYHKKNLYPTPSSDTVFPYTAKGLTISYDETTQVYTVNGTATGVFEYLIRKSSGVFLQVKNGQNLYGKLKVVGGTASSTCTMILRPKNNYDIQVRATQYGVSNAISGDFNLEIAFLYISSGTFDNFKFKVQLEEGTSTTDWEPYIENPTVTLYGKNLLDTRNINRTSARVKFTSNDDGSIHITTGDTTKFGEGFIHIFNPNLTLKAGVTYTFSRKYKGDLSGNYVLYSSGNHIISITSTPKSYTPTEDILIDGVRVYCEDGKTIVGSDVYLQLEVGDPTEFEKYKDLQTAQGDEVLNLTMNYPNTTVICDCPCKVTYKADSTITYYNLKNEQEILKQAIINLGGTI